MLNACQSVREYSPKFILHTTYNILLTTAPLFPLRLSPPEPLPPAADTNALKLRASRGSSVIRRGVQNKRGRRGRGLCSGAVAPASIAVISDHWRSRSGDYKYKSSCSCGKPGAASGCAVEDGGGGTGCERGILAQAGGRLAVRDSLRPGKFSL